MAVDDFHERETSLLPSVQLVTANDDILSSKNQSINQHGPCPKPISNGLSSSCWSSSSGLSTPVASEFGSTETESDDEDDFIAELTRQMADYMLQDDDDDENTAPNFVSESSKSCDLSERSSNCNSGTEYQSSQRFVGTSVNPNSGPPNNIQGFYSDPAFTDDQTGSIQFYQLKNQPAVPMKHQGSSVCWGSQGNMTESTQQLEPKQQLQQKNHHRHHAQSKRRGRGLPSPGPSPPLWASPEQGSGSGMRAVFLRGYGSRSGSCGTGVFLPRGTDDTVKPRKKSGCSRVLIPARVLQALSLHFNNMDALSPSNSRDQLVTSRSRNNGLHSEQRHQSESPAVNNEDMHLPPEWTY